jgi:hypothetical protein
MFRFALAAVALLAPASARADCALWGLTPKVVTPANAVVSSDGGIVVAAVAEPRADLLTGDPAIQPTWRLRIGSDLVTPPIEPLAPGLAVYRVAAANSYKLELEDAKHQPLATVRPARSAGDPLDAPKVKRIWFDAPRSRHSLDRVAVELDGLAPAKAIALVLAARANRSRALDGTGRRCTYAAGGLPAERRRCRRPATARCSWIDDAGRKTVASKRRSPRSPSAHVGASAARRAGMRVDDVGDASVAIIRQ